MSADNGVYILVTNRARGKREYRVNEFQCVENLTHKPNYPTGNPQLNLEVMVDLFGKARVFTDRKIAEGYAIAMLETTEKDGGICEYGIAWLEYPVIRFPKLSAPEDIDRYLDAIHVPRSHVPRS